LFSEYRSDTSPDFTPFGCTKELRSLDL